MSAITLYSDDIEIIRDNYYVGLAECITICISCDEGKFERSHIDTGQIN